MDRLHGLLKFGAEPFVLRKTNFLGFGFGCEKAPSPDNVSIAKHIQAVDERGQAVRSPRVWG